MEPGLTSQYTDRQYYIDWIRVLAISWGAQKSSGIPVKNTATSFWALPWYA
jgi:hypothetical protein